MPNSAFFDFFHKHKKFDETKFIKLSVISIAISSAALFTNHFSVICLHNEQVKIHGNKLKCFFISMYFNLLHIIEIEQY